MNVIEIEISFQLSTLFVFPTFTCIHYVFVKETNIWMSNEDQRLNSEVSILIASHNYIEVTWKWHVQRDDVRDENTRNISEKEGKRVRDSCAWYIRARAYTHMHMHIHILCTG